MQASKLDRDQSNLHLDNQMENVNSLCTWVTSTKQRNVCNLPIMVNHLQHPQPFQRIYEDNRKNRTSKWNKIHLTDSIHSQLLSHSPLTSLSTFVSTSRLQLKHCTVTTTWMLLNIFHLQCKLMPTDVIAAWVAVGQSHTSIRNYNWHLAWNDFLQK